MDSRQTHLSSELRTDLVPHTPATASSKVRQRSPLAWVTGLAALVGLAAALAAAFVFWHPADRGLALGAGKAVSDEKDRNRLNAGVAGDELAAFDQALAQFMRERHIPAGALAVMKDGKLVLARGYGFADRDNLVAVQPNTPFRLASVTKPITAAAVRMLIRDGKLKPDTPVFPLLGVTPPAGRTADPRLNDVTVEHLLNHQGGWDAGTAFDPMFRPLEIAAELGKPGLATADDIVRYMTGQPLQFAPGTKTVYSNYGYCVLGRVIEQVTGKRYLDYVRQEVLAPAGVNGVALGRTAPKDRDPREPYYSDPEWGRDVLDPAAVKPVPVPDGWFYLEALDAHGGLVASAPDVARFLKAYRLSGEPAGTDDPDECFFGSLPGTFTMALRRADGVQIVVLFNQRTDPSGLDYFAIRDAMDQAANTIKQWPTAEVDGTK